MPVKPRSPDYGRLDLAVYSDDQLNQRLGFSPGSGSDRRSPVLRQEIGAGRLHALYLGRGQGWRIEHREVLRWLGADTASPHGRYQYVWRLSEVAELIGRKQQALRDALPPAVRLGHVKALNLGGSGGWRLLAEEAAKIDPRLGSARPDTPHYLDQDVYSSIDLARRLGADQQRVWKAARSGELGHVELGRRAGFRFEHSAVLTWLRGEPAFHYRDPAAGELLEA